MNGMRVHLSARCGQATIAAPRLASAYEIGVRSADPRDLSRQNGAHCRRSVALARGSRAGRVVLRCAVQPTRLGRSSPEATALPGLRRHTT